MPPIKKSTVPRSRTCKVTGGTYQHGSFSHVVHLYLHAPPRHENRVLPYIFRSLPDLFRWFDGLLREFTVHTEAAVDSDKAISALQFFEQKWLKIAVNLRDSGFAGEAQQFLFRWCLLVRSLEIEYGKRMHKGTAYWWMGKTFETLRSLDEARNWHLLALIEDIRTDPNTWKTLGAWSSLINDLQVNPDTVDALGSKAVVYCGKHKWLPSEPEAIWLNLLPHHKRFTRASLPFLRGLAAFLLRQALSKGLTKKQLGDALELFTRYLFASERGFEVLGPSSSPDAQHDVLVRNAHSDVAIAAMGDYILVECKNWATKARAPIIREFAGRLQSTAVKTGVLVSREGISGGVNRQTRSGGKLTIAKEYAQDRTAIVVLSEEHIRLVAEGKVAFSTLLLSLFEDVRFDRI